MKNFLELFSGSGRISARIREAGVHAITIDYDEENKPNVVEDMLNGNN